MDKVSYFERIVIPVPYGAIYGRLGYKQKASEGGLAHNQEVRRFIDEASSWCMPRGAGRRLLIKSKTPETVEVNGGVYFNSKSLSGFLGDCREMLFAASSCGKDVMDKIKEAQNSGNLLKAAVFDATASEMADEGLSWIMEYFDHLLAKEGCSVSFRRISAGYGDFLLENQKTIYNLLGLEKIGIDINDYYALIPEKSVTAVTGII